MPEIFRFYGFSFFFYSREHEPIHIHVEGNEGFAKYNYNGEDWVSPKTQLQVYPLKHIIS